MDMNNLPFTLTIPEVAEIMRVTKDRAYELCRLGILPHRRFGREIRVHRDTFLAWLTGQEVQAGTNDSAAPKDGAAADRYSVVSVPGGSGGARPIPSTPLQALSAASSYPGRP